MYAFVGQDVLGESLGRLERFMFRRVCELRRKSIDAHTLSGRGATPLFLARACSLQKMSRRFKPFTITKKQAMEAMPPKLVERMLYAYRNYPEMGWLEILP